MSNAMVRGGDANTGAIVREGFGETSIEKRGETASTMLAAQAQAEIQSRYVMAVQRPRNDDTVRVKLLRDCSRPSFAARAYYAVPRAGLTKPGRITGTRGVIEGLSVRFAESAIRVSGNILQSTRTVYDDDFKRMVNVSATDLETNAVYSRDLILEKTLERRDAKERTVLGKRTNSAGVDVFVVQSTEEELLVKESALISRAFRTLALRLVPLDVLEECEQAIARTVREEDAKDPDAARKTICDNFAKIGVMPDALALYLGHPIEQCSPAELVEMRGLFAAVHDNEVTMAAAIAEKTGEVAKGETPADAKTKAASVSDKIKARAQRIETTKATKATPPAAPSRPAARPAPASDDALFGAPKASEPADAEPPPDAKLGDDDLGGRE